jgi:hypothetical protein
MPKTVQVLKATLEPNAAEQTKRYIKTFPFPDKDPGTDKSILFLSNDGKMYLSLDKLNQLGVTPENIESVVLTVEVNKKR